MLGSEAAQERSERLAASIAAASTPEQGSDVSDRQHIGAVLATSSTSEALREPLASSVGATELPHNADTASTEADAAPQATADPARVPFDPTQQSEPHIAIAAPRQPAANLANAAQTAAAEPIQTGPVADAQEPADEAVSAAVPVQTGPDADAQEPADGAVSASEESESESDDDGLTSALMAKLLASMSLESKPPPPREPLLESFDLKGIASLIKSGKTKRIVCMVGAGISVSAGIPDFRSPGTGLYDNLAKYNLPHATAVFELDYFRHNPRPFFLLAKELFPGNFQPTPTHYFLKLLHDKGLLLRCFSQNIDSLECQTGLPPEAVVAAHGNFDSARCIACRKEHPTQHVRDAVVRGDETCVCLDCGGLVKPDIVFFGEGLPERFFKLAQADLPAADLLIVMGTSLVVRPFALLINQVSDTTPRLLINREKAGTSSSPQEAALGIGFNFDKGNGNYRDALFLGDCDAGVRRLCRLLGWEAELDALIPPRPAGSAAPVANRGTTVTRSRAAAAVTGQQSSL